MGEGGGAATPRGNGIVWRGQCHIVAGCAVTPVTRRALFRPALDRRRRQCHLPPVSRPDGRSGKGRKAAGEESPGSTETRCRLTAGGGDPRESATESKPPHRRIAGKVRVKGWGKSPPRDRQRDRHGKPHREQNRIGTAWSDELRQVSRPAVRVGCRRRPATGALQRNGRHAGHKPAIQNPAYRPTGTC